MFRNLLNPDNPLMITMSQVTDCIFLSLFWLLGCVPVLTLGASGAALYDDGAPVQSPATLTFVPYYAWGNRGKGERTVWVRKA